MLYLIHQWVTFANINTVIHHQCIIKQETAR